MVLYEWRQLDTYGGQGPLCNDFWLSGARAATNILKSLSIQNLAQILAGDHKIVAVFCKSVSGGMWVLSSVSSPLASDAVLPFRAKKAKIWVFCRLCMWYMGFQWRSCQKMLYVILSSPYSLLVKWDNNASITAKLLDSFY